MFFIFNKDKIISYIVSFSTVIILLGIAFLAKDKYSSVEVMSKNAEPDDRSNMNEVTLTVKFKDKGQCVEDIVECLKKYDVEVTFQNGNWLKSFPELSNEIEQLGYKIEK